MQTILLSFYDVGNVIGYYGCWIFGLTFLAMLAYAMKKYMKP